jgi:hypothetical protein
MQSVSTAVLAALAFVEEQHSEVRSCPSSNRRSGLLAPQTQRSSLLGPSGRAPRGDEPAAAISGRMWRFATGPCPGRQGTRALGCPPRSRSSRRSATRSTLLKMCSLMFWVGSTFSVWLKMIPRSST